MAQPGAVAQSKQYGERTRERARETLRLHARAWRTSPCLHQHHQDVYVPLLTAAAGQCTIDSSLCNEDVLNGNASTAGWGRLGIGRSVQGGGDVDATAVPISREKK